MLVQKSHEFAILKTILDSKSMILEGMNVDEMSAHFSLSPTCYFLHLTFELALICRLAVGIRLGVNIPLHYKQSSVKTVSNALCSNKSKDFKGQNDSTQTMDETNSLVSPDWSLTEKIGNNYTLTDIGFFYPASGFTGPKKKEKQSQENIL